MKGVTLLSITETRMLAYSASVSSRRLRGSHPQPNPKFKNPQKHQTTIIVGQLCDYCQSMTLCFCKIFQTNYCFHY